jgi:hypothetical protein
MITIQYDMNDTQPQLQQEKMMRRFDASTHIDHVATIIAT